MPIVGVRIKVVENTEDGLVEDIGGHDAPPPQNRQHEHFELRTLPFGQTSAGSSNERFLKAIDERGKRE